MRILQRVLQIGENRLYRVVQSEIKFHCFATKVVCLMRIKITQTMKAISSEYIIVIDTGPDPSTQYLLQDG
jgi:hypothetical protein